MKYLVSFILVLALVFLFLTVGQKNKTTDKALLDNKETTTGGEKVRQSTNKENINTPNTKAVKRIKLSLEYKEQAAKKRQFQNLLEEKQLSFSVSKSLKEAIQDLKEASGLEIKLLKKNTLSVFNDQQKTLPESFFETKEVNIAAKDIPNIQIIRYFSDQLNLRFKIDYENEEVLIAGPGIIFDKGVK